MLVVAGRIMVLMIVAWLMHFMLIRFIFRILLRLAVLWTRLLFSFFRSWFIFWVLALGHFTHPFLKVWNYRFVNRLNQHARPQKKDIVWYCIGFAAQRLSAGLVVELNCLGANPLFAVNQAVSAVKNALKLMINWEPCCGRGHKIKNRIKSFLGFVAQRFKD